jgi:hypothetical protein
METMRRWHRPYPITGLQIVAFVWAMLCALTLITLVTLMVSGNLRPAAGPILSCAIFAYGGYVGWFMYARGVYVGPQGLRLQSVDGRLTLRWSEIKSIHSGRSELPHETDPAVWIVLQDDTRIEAPLQGTRVLPKLALGRLREGGRPTWRSTFVLPTSEFNRALAALQECLTKSRHGSLTCH